MMKRTKNDPKSLKDKGLTSKAFAYIRVSDPSQVKGDGFRRQRDQIQKYADHHGIQIQGWYQEKGVSGTLEDRPALAELMISLEQNHHGIRTVLIEKLDRLARDLMVQEAIVKDFQGKGFDLISALEGPDLLHDDPTRKLIRQVFGGVAEYEKQMLVQKLKASRDRIRLKEGKCEGRKGYHDSQEGLAILHRIRQLRRKGKHRRRMTYQQIADLLNSDGITTLDGRPWSMPRVQQLMKQQQSKSKTTQP